MRIGIAGTGKMGSVIATRLASLGHEVTVWNRTRARPAPAGRRPGLGGLASGAGHRP